MHRAHAPISSHSMLLTAAICLLLSLGGLAACSQAPTATAPTPDRAASVALTDTTTAPTPNGLTAVAEHATAATTAPTVVAPTATAVPSTTPPPAEALRAALDHTRALDRYGIHVLFDIVTTLPDGRMEDQINTDFSGTFDQADASYVLNDRAFNYPGTELPRTQLAVITLGGHSYTQGPIRLPSIVPPLWYDLGDQPPPASMPVYRVGYTLDRLFTPVDLTDLAVDGTEPIDQQPCLRYRGEQPLTMALFERFAAREGAGNQQGIAARLAAEGSVVSAATTQVWVCPDGYLHRVSATLTYQRKGAPQGKVDWRINLDLTDHNRPAAISAPPDAVDVAHVPTATPVSDEITLLNAIARSQALRTYQMDFTYDRETAAGRTVLIQYNATFAGLDVSFEFVTPANGDPAQQPTLAAIQSGGMTYARGPLPLPGADQPVWYALGDDPPIASVPPMSAAATLDQLSPRASLSLFTPDGEEPFADQMCSRYTGPLEAALGMMDPLIPHPGPTTPQVRALPAAERMQAEGYTFDRGTAHIVICPDGMVHQIQAEVAGTDPHAQNTPFTWHVNLELQATDGTVPIMPPEAAVMLDPQ